MAVFLVHLGATLFMTGLIWFVQIVHYPLMKAVGRTEFEAYEQRHQRLTSLVVGPAMLLELGTAAWLVLDPPAGVSFGAALAGLAMVGAIWLSTALVQVPLHRRLESGYDAAVIGRLSRSNWLRTLLWTARSVMWLVILRTML